MKKLFKLIITIFISASFLAPAIMAGPKEGKGRKEMRERGKEKKEKGEKREKREKKEKRPKKERKERAKGLERKIERLKVVADRLEKQGKTEQATRLRTKIKMAETKIAEKKQEIESSEDEGE